MASCCLRDAWHLLSPGDEHKQCYIWGETTGATPTCCGCAIHRADPVILRLSTIGAVGKARKHAERGGAVDNSGAKKCCGFPLRPGASAAGLPAPAAGGTGRERDVTGGYPAPCPEQTGGAQWWVVCGHGVQQSHGPARSLRRESYIKGLAVVCPAGERVAAVIRSPAGGWCGCCLVPSGVGGRVLGRRGRAGSLACSWGRGAGGVRRPWLGWGPAAWRSWCWWRSAAPSSLWLPALVRACVHACLWA